MLIAGCILGALWLLLVTVGFVSLARTVSKTVTESGDDFDESFDKSFSKMSAGVGKGFRNAIPIAVGGVLTFAGFVCIIIHLFEKATS